MHGMCEYVRGGRAPCEEAAQGARVVISQGGRLEAGLCSVKKGMVSGGLVRWERGRSKVPLAASGVAVVGLQGRGAKGGHQGWAGIGNGRWVTVMRENMG